MPCVAKIKLGDGLANAHGRVIERRGTEKARERKREREREREGGRRGKPLRMLKGLFNYFHFFIYLSGRSRHANPFCAVGGVEGVGTLPFNGDG